jgi:NADH-quinone oxidoreductase subunit J
MAPVLFFIAGIGAIAGAIGVVVVRNPFYAVLALVSHLLCLAALFLLLRAEFVAAAQVVVYAGAVMVLYVFVVAYVGGAAEPVRPAGGPGLRAGSVVFAGLLAVELLIAVLGSGLKAINSEGAPYVFGFGTPKQIGELLLTRFLFPFEAASFLLLVAAVGAVVLARRRGGLDPSDDLTPVISQRRPVGTGTMREGVGDVNPTPVLGARAGAGVGQATPVGDTEERGW